MVDFRKDSNLPKELCETKYHFCLCLHSHLLYLSLPVDPLSHQDVAVPYKIIGVVDILGPEWPEMLKPNFQPWLGLTVVVDDCSLFHIFNIGLVLITQAKHMPRWINWMNMTFKCNQSRWQGSKLPHCQI